MPRGRDEDGYYWVLGRVDDVMNVSGHRLSTMEIESALVHHPAVAEAAVVGKPHEITGQAVCAFVTLKKGDWNHAELGKELRQWVAKEIGAFARPEEIRFTDALPKTRSGKIMRRLAARNRHDQSRDRRCHHTRGSVGRGEIVFAAGRRVIDEGPARGVRRRASELPTARVLTLEYRRQTRR